MDKVEQDEQREMEQWRGEVNASLRDITKTLQEVAIKVDARPTRPDIELMLNRKVDADLFNAELKAVHNDILDVRGDIAAIKTSPVRAREWGSALIMAGGCLVNALVGSAALVVSILVALHVIH